MILPAFLYQFNMGLAVICEQGLLFSVYIAIHFNAVSSLEKI
jgi:hypothetical protein